MTLKDGLLLDNEIEIKWNYSYEKTLELLSSFSLIKEENNKIDYKSICVDVKTLGLEKALKTKFSFVNNKLVAINFSKSDHSNYSLKELINELTNIFGNPDVTSKNSVTWHFQKVTLKYYKIHFDDYFNEYLEINPNHK